LLHHDAGEFEDVGVDELLPYNNFMVEVLKRKSPQFNKSNFRSAGVADLEELLAVWRQMHSQSLDADGSGLLFYSPGMNLLP
jgi:hypothetical protein